MTLFSNHKWWWAVLVAATLVVSVVTAYEVTAAGLLSSVMGHFAFAIGVSAVPWLVYRLAGYPMSTEQLMATITVAWLILAVANLLVIP